MSQRTSKQALKPVRPSSNAAPDAARATNQIKLGPHPAPPHPFGEAFLATDGYTQSEVLHRALSEQDGKREIAVAGIQEMLVRHHASPEMLKRTRRLHKAMSQLGFGGALPNPARRFPTDSNTRKGNLAEIVLAEYIVATADAELPIYRLRYNPNIEQSMKGDDVLAFDLDANPVRIIVGEAKFRSDSSTEIVRELVESLVRSYKGSAPASLQFVADRLFDSGQEELGDRVFQCAALILQDKLRIDYVGLLLSDTKSAGRVDRATPTDLRRLVMISLGVEAPASLVDDCYLNLE